MKHAFALIIWLSTLAAVFLFTSRGWWLPANIIGEYGDAHRQFPILITALGAAFAVAQIGLVYVVQRFRTTTIETEDAASQGNYGVGIAWTAATAIVFFMLAMMGQYVWVRLRSQKAAASTVQASRVIERQQAN